MLLALVWWQCRALAVWVVYVTVQSAVKIQCRYIAIYGQRSWRTTNASVLNWISWKTVTVGKNVLTEFYVIATSCLPTSIWCQYWADCNTELCNFLTVSFCCANWTHEWAIWVRQSQKPPDRQLNLQFYEHEDVTNFVNDTNWQFKIPNMPTRLLTNQNEGLYFFLIMSTVCSLTLLCGAVLLKQSMHFPYYCPWTLPFVKACRQSYWINMVTSIYL